MARRYYYITGLGVAWRWAPRVISIKRYTKDTRRQDRLRHRGSRVTSLNLRSYNSNNRPPTAGERTVAATHGMSPACFYLALRLGAASRWERFPAGCSRRDKEPDRATLYPPHPHCHAIDICRSWRHIRDIDLQLSRSWWFLHVEKQRKYIVIIIIIFYNIDNQYLFYLVLFS